MSMSRRFALREQQGQTMTEFALVLPLLVLLLFGVIQFGIAFNNYITLTDAVRVGARKAAVSANTEDPEAVAEERVRESAAGLKEDELDVAVSSTWEHGEDVTVTATYPYSISLLGIVVSSGDLESEATERVE
jgi:Flp pilus assembly protein TadG